MKNIIVTMMALVMIFTLGVVEASAYNVLRFDRADYERLLQARAEQAEAERQERIRQGIQSRILIDGVPVQHDFHFQASGDLNWGSVAILPMREVFQTLGGTVVWDGETRTSTLTTPAGDTFAFTITDSDLVKVNGVHTTPIRPLLVDGRILVST